MKTQHQAAVLLAASYLLAGFLLLGCASRPVPPAAQAIQKTTADIQSHAATVDYKATRALDYFQ